MENTSGIYETRLEKEHEGVLLALVVKETVSDNFLSRFRE